MIVCQKQGNDYLAANGASVYSQASTNFSGRNDGVITIQAVTTNPTKGTIVTDRIISSRYGNRLVAEYQYEQSTAGAIGSGEYLFTLPASLSFDSNEVIYKTDAIYSATLSQSFPKSVVGFGTCAVGAGSGYVGHAMLVAYDSTRFRVLCDYNNGAATANQTVVIGSASYFTLDLAKVGYGLKIDAPISGWSNSSSVVGSFAGYTNVPGYQGLVDTFSFSFGTTAATTQCTASPCSYFDQIGTGATSVTRNGIGDYTANFSRTYSKLKCTGIVRESNGSQVTSMSPITCASCSTFQFITLNTASAVNKDSYGTIMCQGTY
jgi:hypothetical protein